MCHCGILCKSLSMKITKNPLTYMCSLFGPECYINLTSSNFCVLKNKNKKITSDPTRSGVDQPNGPLKCPIL